MIENPPTVEFCLSVARLSWGDVLWAVEKRIWGWRDVWRYAEANLDNVNSAVFSINSQITFLDKNDASEIMSLARDALSIEGGSEHSSDRWKFLLLKWVYEKRNSFDSPLSVAEDLYAEFGYPHDMEGFIRFLPPSDGWDPTKHSRDENEARLFDKWRDYLEAAKLNV